ncbi:MAG: ribosome maturation factor RimP [Deltaproteobacteria bacterium]|nr:ribosome maturation factor RimP [Deltaproteobacteria bacterium]
MVDRQQLERVAEGALAAVGYDLVDLEFVGDQESRQGESGQGAASKRDRQSCVLRIFIDHPHQGLASRDVAPRRITLDDCTKATRQLGTVLDVDDPIDGAYRLEVSSPGVLRSLRKARDFKRFIDWQVKVKMRDKIDGRRNFVGRLAAVSDDEIVVDVDGTAYELPLSELAKARLGEEY